MQNVQDVTDRELLELAAKAAAMPPPYDDNDVFTAWIPGADPHCEYGHWWDPLNDDGDALRLAVKLRMDIEQSVPQDNDLWVCVSIAESGVEGGTENFDDESHRAEATRRAIVRASAAIGRSMP